MIDTIVLEDVERIKRDLKRQDFEGKRVLVTGGAGFLGSWICDVLSSLDSQVACLDNLSTGKMDYIKHLLDKQRFRFLNQDVCTFKGDETYDLIFHLASHASPEEYQRNPIETLRTNSFGSQNVAELARKLDSTVLFASTSEVYGEASVIPTPESYWGNANPVGLRSCYFEGKRFAESLFMAYHRKYGLDVKLARIFNSYGPRLREDGLYGRAVSRFIMQALTAQPITVYGDGKQTRSFCYVTDTVSGLMLLTVNEKASGRVVNVGNSEETTVLEVAQKVRRLTGSESALTFHPLPEDDPRRRSPEITLMKKVLGWKPKITLEQGLARTVAWFSKSFQSKE